MSLGTILCVATVILQSLWILVVVQLMKVIKRRALINEILKIMEIDVELHQKVEIKDVHPAYTKTLYGKITEIKFIFMPNFEPIYKVKFSDNKETEYKRKDLNPINKVK